MTTFVAIDFETATICRDSACAVGLAAGCGGRIVLSRTYLIRPPSPQFTFTDLHGLGWEDVVRMQYLYAIMLIGYARVSTGEQTTAAQVAALKTSGCELIFRDNASGGRWDRPELHKLLSQLRKGDVLVVWTLDRLSRSLRDVLTIMERVQERHAGFRSLKEAVDTTTPAGRMMMQMVGAFAEFERAMLKERTKAGLDAARKEGRIGGRPPKLKPHQQQEIVTLVKQGKKTAADAARLFGVHPATVSRLLRRT